MSRIDIEVKNTKRITKCDTCDKEITESDNSSWGASTSDGHYLIYQHWAQSVNRDEEFGGRSIGENRNELDICTKCLDEIIGFMKNIRNERIL